MIFRCGLVISALLLVAQIADARPKDFLKKSDAWFAGDEAQRIAKSILSFQSETGGWPKNVDTTAAPYTGDRSQLKGTYDNGATTDELRFLARIYNATKDSQYHQAFDRGLDYILKGQYQNGGWPQFSPPGTGYHRHITFNDGAMVRLLEFLREVATADQYDFVDDNRRQAATTAVSRGIDCLLKCQIRVEGTLTVWCAQHDEIDFRPQSARTFELATLSGCESAGITRFLMSIDDPSPEIVQSVDAAIAWFERSKLTGIRVAIEKDKKGPEGVNRVVVGDEHSPPLWARFYQIESNQPVFVDRDGIPKPTLAEIGYERRNGYAWYGTWPQKLLSDDYPKWKRKISLKVSPS